MLEQSHDVMTKTAYAASAATSGGGLWLWLGDNAQAIGAVGVLIGIILGVATFIVNWYYRHKTYKKQ